MSIMSAFSFFLSILGDVDRFQALDENNMDPPPSRAWLIAWEMQGFSPLLVLEQQTRWPTVGKLKPHLGVNLNTRGASL